MELIGIVMGAVPTYEVENIIIKTYGSFEESKVLLDHALSQFEYRQIFYPEQAVSQHPVADGATDVILSPDRKMSAVLPVDLDPAQLSWVYGSVASNIQAPVKAGEVLSNLQVWYQDTCVAQTDLVAMYDVPVWQAQNNVNNGSNTTDNGDSSVVMTVIWVVLGGLAGILVILAAVNAIRKAVIKSRRKRRRREQRRRYNA